MAAIQDIYAYISGAWRLLRDNHIYNSGVWRAFPAGSGYYANGQWYTIRPISFYASVGSIVFTGRSESRDFMLYASHDWELVSKPDWCSLSQSSGTHESSPAITASATDNLTVSTRAGSVVFRLKVHTDVTVTLNVSQPSALDLFVNPPTIDTGSPGSSIAGETVTITAYPPQFRCISKPAWMTGWPEVGTQYTSGSYVMRIPANEGEARSGIIEFVLWDYPTRSARLTISQAALITTGPLIISPTEKVGSPIGTNISFPIEVNCSARVKWDAVFLDGYMNGSIMPPSGIGRTVVDVIARRTDVPVKIRFTSGEYSADFVGMHAYPDISASSASLTWAYSEGRAKTVSLYANFPWTADQIPAGYSVSPQSGGAGTTTVTITAPVNSTAGNTNGSVRFKLSSFANTYSVSVLNKFNPTLTLTPASIAASQNGQAISIAVASNSPENGAVWKYTAKPAWITTTLVAGTWYPTATPFTGTVSSNTTTPGDRSGSIQFENGNLTRTTAISQPGYPESLSFTPASWPQFSTAVGSNKFTISAFSSANGRKWKYTAIPAWVTSAAGLALGSWYNEGEYTWNIAQNTGVARSGNITISNDVFTKNFAVSQAANVVALQSISIGVSISGDIPAAGGQYDIACTATYRDSNNVVTTKSVTPSISISGAGFTIGSLNRLSAIGRGSEVGPRRSGTINASYTDGGITKTAALTVYQQANAVTNTVYAANWVYNWTTNGNSTRTKTATNYFTSGASAAGTSLVETGGGRYIVLDQYGGNISYAGGSTTYRTLSHDSWPDGYGTFIQRVEITGCSASVTNGFTCSVSGSTITISRSANSVTTTYSTVVTTSKSGFGSRAIESVTQNAVPLTVSVASASFGYAGGAPASIPYISSANGKWYAQNVPAWITGAVNGTLYNSGPMNLTALTNGGSARSATITLYPGGGGYSLNLTVSQAAYVPPPGARISVSPSWIYPSVNSPMTVTVSCAAYWEAEVTQGSATMTINPSSASGNRSVQITIWDTTTRRVTFKSGTYTFVLGVN